MGVFQQFWPCINDPLTDNKNSHFLCPLEFSDGTPPLCHELLLRLPKGGIRMAGATDPTAAWLHQILLQQTRIVESGRPCNLAQTITSCTWVGGWVGARTRVHAHTLSHVQTHTNIHTRTHKQTTLITNMHTHAHAHACVQTPTQKISPL